MNTTTAIASSVNSASVEKTIRYQSLDSTGDTDLVLTVTKAAERAFDMISNAGRWLFTTKNGVDGMTPINLANGTNKENGILTLIGIFNDADGVILTEALVGGYGDPESMPYHMQDEDSDVTEDEEVTDGYAEDEIIGSVNLSYVDDVDGESAVLDKLTHQPQLVVSIVTNDDGSESVNVLVRNTDKSKDKLIANASFILAALSKVQRDEV